MSEPAVDLALLRMRTFNNAALMNELLRMFQTQLVQVPQKLRVAIDARDRESVHQMTHRFKGSAATVGARVLASLLSVAETHAAAGGSVAELLPAIESEAGRCLAEIETVLPDQT